MLQQRTIPRPLSYLTTLAFLPCAERAHICVATTMGGRAQRAANAEADGTYHRAGTYRLWHRNIYAVDADERIPPACAHCDHVLSRPLTADQVALGLGSRPRGFCGAIRPH